MSTYVMSDIHGCYTAFRDMLKKINFTDDDHLIIAGDIVDRGPENYEILKWFESSPENVTFLVGNHDDEFAYYCSVFAVCMNDREARKKIDYYITHPASSLQNMDRYGTVRELIRDHGCDENDFRIWSEMIRNLPYYKKLTVNGRKYIIVHAGYIDEDRPDVKKLLRMYNYHDITQYYMWAREDALDIGGVQDTTIIFGHTPTIAETAYYTGGTVFTYESRILNSKFINLDCGYVYKDRFPIANMAAIRLEDEQIFYLDDIEKQSFDENEDKPEKYADENNIIVEKGTEENKKDEESSHGFEEI